MPAQTLYNKLFSAHVVTEYDDGASLLYIDRHMLHDVSSAQAFAELKQKSIAPRRRGTHLAVADHAVPTIHRDRAFSDAQAARQVDLLARNCAEAGVTYLPLNDRRHGIVHVIGPEEGFTLPGTTLVCGDSHTSTHGAFGALAFGVGTSESACVLATQTVRQRRAKSLEVRVEGALPAGVSAKDLALVVVGTLGASGAVGYAIETTGSTVAALSMSERMTLCNMSIEAGARSGLVAPDTTTFAWLEGRPRAPQGQRWEQALDYWRTLVSDVGAQYDLRVQIDATTLAPQVTWGTSPHQVAPITGRVPDPAAMANEDAARQLRQVLAYMGLTPGMALSDIAVDVVFIGSCTNSRIEDLRAAAAVLRGRRIAPRVRGLVVPGSARVKAAAKAEGLDVIFKGAGLEWRDAGCSLCVAINDDRLQPGERCASTSNRNFEGRQGVGARTHLVSPAMAAAAAVAGHFVDVRQLDPAHGTE